jgi:aerobic-type carbon monoxide dehydrogenase small subunit (CoxS/CutS family)
MSARSTITMNVNGRPRRVTVPPMKRLLDVLRDECGLPGTKEGCGEGECGACSVLLDGRVVCACLVPAVQADGAKVVTVEGLARGARLSALQQAFLDFGGAQCGICTPGMLVASVELLRRTRGRVPGDAEVREALAGNLCRCTGYQKIVDAVRAAARAALPGKPKRKTATVKPKRKAAAKSKPKRTTAKAKPKRAARRVPRSVKAARARARTRSRAARRPRRHP